MILGGIVGFITGWILSYFGLPAWFFGTFQLDFPFPVTMTFYYLVFIAIGVVIGYLHNK